jgi:hypothetical protein
MPVCNVLKGQRLGKGLRKLLHRTLPRQSSPILDLGLHLTWHPSSRYAVYPTNRYQDFDVYQARLVNDSNVCQTQSTISTIPLLLWTDNR